jgi:hypothetical protein
MVIRRNPWEYDDDLGVPGDEFEPPTDLGGGGGSGGVDDGTGGGDDGTGGGDGGTGGTGGGTGGTGGTGDQGTGDTTTDPNMPDPNEYYDAGPGYQGTGDVDLGPGVVPKAGEGPGAFKSSGTGTEPEMTEWGVTDEQTVAGQLEKNYDKDSPFMEKARLKAERRHQAQGGQNSLMAQKAGMMAAMDTAFKVSFADAATYARSAEFNAAMKNQFGLAEQRFIQNSLLSEQNYKQSVELQTQMIAGQLEGIRQEYLGKGKLMDKDIAAKFALMDKEFGQFFQKAAYTAQLKEFAEQSGYQRQVSIQGMISQGNFLLQGFDSVMQYANNPNFTPEQSAAAARSGLSWFRDTFDVGEAYWASVGAGPDRGGDFPNPPSPPWWDFTGG